MVMQDGRTFSEEKGKYQENFLGFRKKLSSSVAA